MNISKAEIFGYIIILVLVVVVGWNKFNEGYQDFKSAQSIRNEKKAQVADLQMKMDTINAAANQRTQLNAILKPFYQQEYAPLDSIASFGGMFEDIVDYVKINGLLLRSIQYNINPENDLIFTNFAGTHNSCAVHLFVIGTYKQFQNFINAIHEYPYYINIDSIEVTPYQNNKSYLLCHISINLYSKK